ncbi:hypothetical protein [Archangium lansingense]|uniref:Lipoprotein n=1 Tax=Archangium lansingense TaxID=2995310 RepID=A0ABT4AD11_9BACT|nr:hypothetical protein [Archangium lansinium]MCY1079550.1 hypothetical protein [Archangium lansinium]
MERSRRHVAFLVMFLLSCTSEAGTPASSLASGKDAGQTASGKGVGQTTSGKAQAGTPSADEGLEIKKELEAQGLALARDKAGRWYLGTRQDGKLLLSKPFGDQEKRVDLVYEQPRQQTVLTVVSESELATRTGHELIRTTYSLDVEFREGAFRVERWTSRQDTKDLLDGTPDKFTEQMVDFVGKTVTKNSSGNSPPDVKAPLLVAGNSFDEQLAFRDFVPVYGAKNLKDDSDLSVQLMMRWDAEKIHFKLKVRDDFVLFGKDIHTDHVELWGLPKGGGQHLVYFYENEEIWLVSAESPASKHQLRGEYMLMLDGYEVKFEIPYFLHMTSGSFKGEEFVGGTIVISDTDRDGKQETLIATSALKPKSSWTWGKIFLRGKSDLPELSAETVVGLY